MKKCITLVALCGVMSGCVSVQQLPISSDAEQKVAGKKLSTLQYKKPDFAAMTAGKAAFALIGAALMISEGNKIIEENKVQDPASFISESLSKDLQGKYKTVAVTASAKEVETDDIDELVKLSPESELIFDVRTINWSFAYFPTDWSHYRVIYSTKARLIDTKEKKVLAEGFCARVPEQVGNEPTYDELMANEASRLKSALQEAATHCANQFKKDIFKL